MQSANPNLPQSQPEQLHHNKDLDDLESRVCAQIYNDYTEKKTVSAKEAFHDYMKEVSPNDLNAMNELKISKFILFSLTYKQISGSLSIELLSFMLETMQINENTVCKLISILNQMSTSDSKFVELFELTVRIYCDMFTNCGETLVCTPIDEKIKYLVPQNATEAQKEMLKAFAKVQLEDRYMNDAFKYKGKTYRTFTPLLKELLIHFAFQRKREIIQLLVNVFSNTIYTMLSDDGNSAEENSDDFKCRLLCFHVTSFMEIVYLSKTYSTEFADVLIEEFQIGNKSLSEANHVTFAFSEDKDFDDWYTCKFEVTKSKTDYMKAEMERLKRMLAE